MTNNSYTSGHSTTVSPATRMAARSISFLFSPLLVPAYCTWMTMWGTSLSWLPDRIRWIAVLYTFLFTGIIPFGLIAVMRFCGQASDLALTDRRQRIIPYVAGMLCYAAAYIYFHKAHAPEWFYMFFAGAGASILVSLLISLRWKISAHGAAMGGWLAMMLRIMTGPYMTADLASFAFPCIVIFTGAVCTSRLILEAHTPMQLLAGVINGFTCVWICTSVATQY